MSGKVRPYTAVGAVSPTYDGNSNLTSDGTFTFGYDAENRLTSASGAGSTASYAFDSQGRRKLKTVNGAATITVTDADNRAVLDYDGSSGALLRWYAYGLGSNDVLNQITIGGSRLTMIPDIQGSLVATLDSGTGTLSRQNYLPYGKAASATIAGTFGYTGQRIDPETNGLYYYRARMYHPLWGRFMQPDPLGTLTDLPQASVAGTGNRTNLYVYVGNDPLNQTDPSGNDPIVGATAGLLLGAYYGAVGGYFAPGSSALSILAGAAAGGLSGAFIGLFDPSFGIYTIVAIGAVAGGAGDVLGQMVSNVGAGKSATNINYGATVGAIIGGAISGAGGGYLSGRLAAMGVSQTVATTMAATSITSGPGALFPMVGGAMVSSRSK